MFPDSTCVLSYIKKTSFNFQKFKFACIWKVQVDEDLSKYYFFIYVDCPSKYESG